MLNNNFNYEKIDTGYYDNIYNKNNGIRSAWHHIKFNFVKKNIITSHCHLDIGCGSGTFISLLNNKLSVGIDISKKQINFARKNYSSKNKKFFVYKKKIPFKKNYFDSISLIELIEHLSDNQIKLLMKEVHRVLKKNGSIYITTPNYFSLWPLLEFFLNKLSKVSYEHQHINKFNYLNLNKIIELDKYFICSKQSFIYISPFLAFFSFKLSLMISKIENFIFKFFPGFLLFMKLKKK